MDPSTWYADAKFGMFIHWGLYALLGRGEWCMHRDGIPPAEYQALSTQWNPRPGAIDDWCRTAAASGARYAVFTARHHDGFSLFDTRADAFSSLHTPAGRDHVREFTDACRKHGLRVGLYYSLADWRLRAEPEKMVAKVHSQIRELLSNYGQIDILWFDGGAAPPGTTAAAFWRSDELCAEIRRLQPGILITDRCGVKGDIATIEGRNIIRRPAGARLWELCMTLGDDDFAYWGYCRHSAFRKTPEQALLLLLHSMEYGGNLLLNVGPDGAGAIPDWQRKIFAVMGEWIGANAEAVYGTRATDIARAEPFNQHLQGNSCGLFMQGRKPDVHYFYCYAWPGTEMRIPLLRAEVHAVSILKTGQKLNFFRDDHDVLHVTDMPAEPPDPLCTVLKFGVSPRRSS